VKHRAVGVTSGIGSMLVGARAAGFDVVGNLEWRKYYHDRDDQGRNTFTENFPGAIFKEKIEDLTPQEIERVMNPTLALSHPECGRYSHLDAANKKANPDRGLDAADIPLAVDLFAKLKPRFFVMDDLPGSFVAYPMSAYAEKLPEYDLYPEWVSNWGYGNIQKYRNRMFMVGSLKSEGWAFTPSEMPHNISVQDVLEDLGDPRRPHNITNHEPQDMAVLCSRALGLGGYKKRNTWADVRDHFTPLRPGSTLRYVRGPDSDELALRIGFYKHHWDKYSGVLTGGNAALHSLRNEPYSIRERARIQGFPDDFIFYGTLLNDRGEWNHDENLHMVKQTGKAMPVQFCTYASHQIMLHCLGKTPVATNTRVLPPNVHISEAKKWYCSNVGYADQERACGSCWLYARCSIRQEKYGIGTAVAAMPTKPKPPPQVPRPPRPPPEPRPPAAAKRGLQRPSPTRKIVAEEDFVFRSTGSVVPG
jgi:site-specific DNA-cytosine methylase